MSPHEETNATAPLRAACSRRPRTRSRDVDANSRQHDCLRPTDRLGKVLRSSRPHGQRVLRRTQHAGPRRPKHVDSTPEAKRTMSPASSGPDDSAPGQSPTRAGPELLARSPSTKSSPSPYTPPCPKHQAHELHPPKTAPKSTKSEPNAEDRDAESRARPRRRRSRMRRPNPKAETEPARSPLT
jgi:hypothetical protein